MIIDKNIDDSYLEEDPENSLEDTSSEETKEAVQVDSIDTTAEDNSSKETKEAAQVDSTDSPAEDPSSEETEEPAKVDSTDSPAEDEINFPHLIGKKIGMTQIFLDDGNSLPATVLEMGPCYITQIKSETSEGYNSIQLSFEDINDKKANKASIGHFLKSKVSPKKYLKEFRCGSKDLEHNLGDVVTINQLDLGDFVRVTGTSKGKGFTGHMKRHGFGGGRRSHGKNSVMRKAGSIGAGSDPSRVFPGMKMAGRKGNYTKTIKNLSVIKLDHDNNLVFVTGSVPGANNSLIYLSKI